MTFIYTWGRGLRFPGMQFKFVCCNIEKCHVSPSLTVFCVLPGIYGEPSHTHMP